MIIHVGFQFVDDKGRGGENYVFVNVPAGTDIADAFTLVDALILRVNDVIVGRIEGVTMNIDYTENVPDAVKYKIIEETADVEEYLQILTRPQAQITIPTINESLFNPDGSWDETAYGSLNTGGAQTLWNIITDAPTQLTIAAYVSNNRGDAITSIKSRKEGFKGNLKKARNIRRL